MHQAYDADLLKIRAENATFNGILIGSVVMTEILVWWFDAVSGPGKATEGWTFNTTCPRSITPPRKRYNGHTPKLSQSDPDLPIFPCWSPCR